jgi:hypothetical protein
MRGFIGILRRRGWTHCNHYAQRGKGGTHHVARIMGIQWLTEKHEAKFIMSMILARVPSDVRRAFRPAIQRARHEDRRRTKSLWLRYRLYLAGRHCAMMTSRRYGNISY